jgi:hypothetical protein
MSFIASVAVLFAAVTVPVATATTAYTNVPISITRCSSANITGSGSYGDAPTELILGSRLELRFVNTGSKPISAVTFDVNEDGHVEQIKDVGNFSPGVQIAHYFQEGLLSPSGSAECRVASVEYSDGSGAEETAAR